MYIAKVKGLVDKESLRKLASCVVLDGFKTSKAKSR